LYPYVQYKSNKSYLMVEIMRVENIICPDSIGIPNSFVEVDWNSQVQKTTVCEDSYMPLFNQQLMFRLHTINQLQRKDLINVQKPKELRAKDIDEFTKINKKY